MDAYSTHFPVTALALMKTGELFPEMPILECGCGDYSSPMIHLMKGQRKHHILSADPGWYKRYEDIADRIQHVDFVGLNKWGRYSVDEEYGLCLLDSEEFVVHRMGQIEHLLGKCRVIVMHDAKAILKDRAKHNYIYNRFDPWTWVGSDSIDVREWF